MCICLPRGVNYGKLMKPDSILEECYRIKEEYSAKFKDVRDLFEHLKEIDAEEDGRSINIYE